jgi:hypothetical protein
MQCVSCGYRHPRLEHALIRQQNLSTGNGVIMCALCDLPLADHPSVMVHADLSELSLRRMRSPGVPSKDQTGVVYG